MERRPNTIYVASISYGKDSIAMLEAIRKLGYPLDRIISAQVWATDTIPADLPEMYAWKAEADKKIYERYGIMPERICAENKTYDSVLHSELKDGAHKGNIKGFPQTVGAWCGKLKNEYVKWQDYVKKTYEQLFYERNGGGQITGYQRYGRGNHCSSELKGEAIEKFFQKSP